MEDEYTQVAGINLAELLLADEFTPAKIRRALGVEVFLLAGSGPLEEITTAIVLEARRYVDLTDVQTDDLRQIMRVAIRRAAPVMET